MLNKMLRAIALFCISTLLATLANAAPQGVYFTGQLGYANTHTNINPNGIVIITVNGQSFIMTGLSSVNPLTNNGFAGRLATGYQFNSHLAFEVGYFRLPNKKINADIDLVSNQTVQLLPETDILKVNQTAIDLAVKAILPLTIPFNVYGKLGAAYLMSDASASSALVGLNTNTALPPIRYDFPEVTKYQWAPEAAIGVSYDVTPNVFVDASWTHIHPVGSNRTGNIDFVVLGAGYHFG